MKRLLSACCVLLGLAVGTGPAAAQQANPAELCGANDVYVREIVWRGHTIHRELEMATRGGCVSSWATDSMSVAAVAGQCRRLEEGVILGAQPFVLTYPHVFYGIWRAENRSDCIKILHGLATGELDADVLPFPV